MALDGGRVAARGLQYQYLRTVEALLANIDHDRVTACRVEGPAYPVSQQAVDAVDFDLVGPDGVSLLAAQVKSSDRQASYSAREAVLVLLHLVDKFDAREYRLISSAVPHENCLRLAALLEQYGDDDASLKAQIETLLVTAPTVQKLCAALSPIQWQRMGRARIEFDPRDDAQIREDLSRTLRRLRDRAGRGLSQDSGGLLVWYLVAETMRRAADPRTAEWSVKEFRNAVLLEDRALFEVVGRQDFGLVYGTIPFTADIGRPQDDARLDAALSGEQTARETAVYAVTGLSGVGKSSLAAAYIARRAYRYDAVFWLDAESEESLTASFARLLAHMTGVEDASVVADPRLLRERVHARLQALPGPWLMVFDDANARDVTPWLPRRGQGQIIVTSLGGSWRVARQHLELGPMRAEEAALLLQTRLRLTAEEAVAHQGTLSQLAGLLEYWPLAIEVACGYLISCAIPVGRLGDYTHTLLERAADDRDSRPPGYPRTLVAAVRMSLERMIEAAGSKGLEHLTLGTLAAMCWVSPRRVPVHLAMACALVSAIDAGSEIPGRILIDEAALPVREVIRELLNVSLVRYDEPLTATAEAFAGSEDTVTMNAVLQQIIARLLHVAEGASTSLPTVALHTTGWLREAMRTRQTQQAWQLAVHAATLVERVKAADLADLPTALLVNQLAGLHHAHGDYATARELAQLELTWLERADQPDGLAGAEAHFLLAHIGQLTRRVEDAVAHLRRLLPILRQLAAHPTDAVSLLANQALLIVQMLSREGQNRELTGLLREFEQLARRLPGTRLGQRVRALIDIQRHISAGQADRAEKAIIAALADNRGAAGDVEVELRRLLIDALAAQEKWQQADAALDEFLPHAGPLTLDAFSVHHLVHDVGVVCALNWIATGEESAARLLGRLLLETGIQENPALETPTDQARFLLLRAVYTGWRAVNGLSPHKEFLELLRQLNDKPLDEPYDPSSAWERIYRGLAPRMASQISIQSDAKFLAEASYAIAPDGALLDGDPAVRAAYHAAECHVSLELPANGKLYDTMALNGSLDVFRARPLRTISATPVAIFEPRYITGATNPTTGKSLELQVQRACSKGLRRLVGPHSSIPVAQQLRLIADETGLSLQHEDGTVLGRSATRADGPWLTAARRHKSVLVFFGHGLELYDPAEHKRIIASPREVARRFTDASSKGLLAAAAVPFFSALSSKPPAQRAPVGSRRQPRKSSRSKRRGRRP